MITVLHSVIIFGLGEAKREVTFKPGLNILTGDSKTGKSALIEIIDYCLFSSRSTIPKGVITNFGRLYVVVLRIGKEFIIIGRPEPSRSDSTKCFFSIETDLDLIKNLSLGYFSHLLLKPRKQVQAEVEAHIGLCVTDITNERRDGKAKEGKASMRNMMSFLFQHQNLIASKHAIFYRFDDNAKRAATIEEWPVFMGWVDGQYYLLKRQLSELLKEIRTEERIVKSIQEKSKKNKGQLTSLLGEYYSVIGMQLPKDLLYEKLLVIANDLPDLPEMKVGNAEALHKLKELEVERDQLGVKKQEIEEQLSMLAQCKDASVSYARFLSSIHRRVAADGIGGEVHCPLCQHSVPEVNVKVREAVQAREKLQDELNNLGGFNVDNTEAMESLFEVKAEIDLKIRNLNAHIARMNSYNNALKAHANRKAEANKYKGRIEWVVKEVLDASKTVKARETLDELREKQRMLEAQLQGYDIEHKYSEANTLLSKYMNVICDKLDFEEELKPPKLRFDTRTFDFFHLKDNEKIRLYEMGSGANWLACHLSLFLGLLWYSCFESTSTIPKFLFLDQPSQVYFPRGDEDIRPAVTEAGTFKVDTSEATVSRIEKDDNIKQVKNIFLVIDTILKEIKEDTGLLPQVILTEHADPVNLGLQGFEQSVLRRWTTDGDKLI